LAGFRADERPISFLLGESEIRVRSILENWREPDYLCFRIKAEDGALYELRNHQYEDYWEVKEASLHA
jgi:hypothetical protein